MQYIPVPISYLHREIFSLHFSCLFFFFDVVASLFTVLYVVAFLALSVVCICCFLAVHAVHVHRECPFVISFEFRFLFRNISSPSPHAPIVKFLFHQLRYSVVIFATAGIRVVTVGLSIFCMPSMQQFAATCY